MNRSPIKDFLNMHFRAPKKSFQRDLWKEGPIVTIQKSITKSEHIYFPKKLHRYLHVVKFQKMFHNEINNLKPSFNW
jgi:hypothetical protein